MTDPRLAALWLDALGRLADRAAHELNNALNGVIVNLEVVRARARPEADVGRVAPFAEAAVEQAEGATALAGALLALSRPARAGRAVDAAVVARQVCTLLAPAVAHRGIRVWLEAAEAAPVALDPHAVRAAVTLLLLAGGAAAEAASEAAAPPLPAAPSVPADELGGSNPANESLRRLRCTVSSDSPVTVRVEPAGEAWLPDSALALLREAGADVAWRAGAATITFRETGREHA